MKIKDSGRRLFALLLSLLFLLALLPSAAGATEEMKHLVTFHVTVNRYPWQWVDVIVHDTAGQEVMKLNPDASGDIVMELPNGNYTYSSNYGGTTGISSVSNQPLTVSGDMTVPVVLTTTATDSHEVRISVTDADNALLDGATVNIVDFSYNTNVITSAETVDGVATLYVGTGTYDVTVSKFGYASYNGGGVLNVDASGNTSGASSFTLQPTAGGTYDATFTVRANGVLWKGAGITMYSNGEQIGDVTMTDAQGKAVISGLPEGTYTYSVVCPGYSSLTNQSLVINGGNQSVTVEVPAPTATTYPITIPIQDSEGNALDGVTVTLRIDGNFFASGKSADGKVTFNLPDGGPWEISAAKQGYKSAAGNISVTSGSKYLVMNGTYTSVIQLTASDLSIITGNVTTDTGIGTVTLTLYKGTKDSPGEKVEEQTVDIPGTAAAFAIEPSAPLDGEYFLVASCEGFTSCYVSGITGTVDITETLELYGGDLSGDGRVNDDDYLLFMAEYAKGGTAGGIADVNHDGAVNDDDYLLFMANYANAEKSQDKVITL